MSEVRTGSIVGVVVGCTLGIVAVGAAIVRLRKFLAAGHANVEKFLQQRPAMAATEELAVHRHAVCEQLRNCVVRPEAARHVEDQVGAVLTAPTVTELERAHEHLATMIHQEQQAIMHELAPQVAEATSATGFTTVRHLPQPDRLLVIGENHHGQAVQHELIAAPNQALQLRSETLGFHDGTCGQVLDAFQEELRQRGITIAHEGTASTLREKRRQRARVRA